MKIGWMTPFHAKSAIGHFSAEVTRELLALGQQVTIIRSETGAALALPQLPTKAPLITWKKEWKPDRFDLITSAIIIPIMEVFSPRSPRCPPSGFFTIGASSISSAVGWPTPGAAPGLKKLLNGCTVPAVEKIL